MATQELDKVLSMKFYAEVTKRNGDDDQNSTPLSLVRRHNSKFHADCALFDTSMKFGTLIAVTDTSIFRCSAKLDVRWYSWQPQFIKIYEFSPFVA